MPYITEKAIGQEAARKGAQQQILHGRFVGALAGAQEAHHHIERERHQFQADEESD
jgi:hypothetical protein